MNNDCLVSIRPADMTEEEYLKDSFKKTFAYGSSLRSSPTIILMHETYRQSADMLEWAIQYVLDAGYTFGSLSSLESGWYY